MEHTYLAVRTCPFKMRILCLTEVLTDNEFTQLMKGLQGERLRQAFRYLDKDQDGYISPDQFKRIILVCFLPPALPHPPNIGHRKLQDTNCLMLS